MPRWPLLVLAALVLSVPAASAARQPCWKGVIDDWYDSGKIDRTWSCGCVQEAIAHLPESLPAYSNAVDVMRAAEKRVCAQPVARRAAAPAKPKQSHHTNWPARISATVLMVVTAVLLFWRRRGGRIRR